MMESLQPIEWRNASHVPEMPQIPNPTDTDAVWQYVAIGLNRIIFEPAWGIDIQSLVGLYTTVHNLCTSQKVVTTYPVNRHGAPAHLIGEELYISLTNYLHQYLDMIKQRLKLLHGQSLLDCYLDEYAHFTNSAQIIHYIFRYLNRHWVKRELDNGKTVYEIYTLHLVLWHSELFHEISCDLVKAISELVEKYHDGEVIESGNSKALIKFVVSLGLDATGSSQTILDVYGSILEIPLRKGIISSSQRSFLHLLYEESLPTYEDEPARTEMEERLVALTLCSGFAQPLTPTNDNTGMVKLVTKDLAVIEVEQNVAKCSFIIKHLCAYFGEKIIANEFIALPNVNETTLRRVLEWCDYHKDDSDTALANTRTSLVDEWDKEYMQVDQEILFEIILAANYLDIGPLLDLGCKTIANLVKGKSAEGIRNLFNITNDFTLEEEEQIRRENEWAEDY